MCEKNHEPVPIINAPPPRCQSWGVQRILTAGFLHKKLFPCLIELAPGGKTTLEQAKPDVEKFCYVISGRVKCSIGHP